MLPPEDLSRLRDMLAYSRRVEQHVAGATRADFDADEQLQTTEVHSRVWHTATERIPHLVTTLTNLLP